MRKFLVLAAIVCIASTAQTALADATPTPTPTATPTAIPTPTPTPTPVIPPLVQQIREAKTMLASVSLNYALNPHYKTVKTKSGGKTVSKKVLSNYTLDAKDIALAIVDPATGNIEITKAMQTGKTFKFPDPAFDVQARGFNGVNTPFTVNKPAGGVVLALKYLVTGPESGTKAAILAPMYDAIYVPYSSGLNFADVSAYGANYLSTVIDQVAVQLRNEPSQAIPGETITQAIKPTIIKSLIYAEHMDTNEFTTNPDTQSLIDKVNVLFAGNEGDTYRYSVSSGNAIGISQFIPSTYQALVKRHPEANLNPDTVAGLTDHVNAIKAEYLLIDDYIADVQSRAANFNPAYMYDYGAASYNGGVTRVVNAVATFGQNWQNDHADQVNQAQTQVTQLTATVRSLKAQVKATAVKTKKTALNAQLATANSQLSAAQTQLTALQNASLRNETVLYLLKMHALIQIFNGEAETTVARF